MGRMRLLPAAAIGLALLLGLKAVGLGEEFSAMFGAGPARAESPPAAGAAEHPAAPAPAHDAAPAATCPPAGEPTASEADVLESLAQRREQLDAREREIDLREKTLAAAEKRVEQRIAELKAIQGNVEALFGKRDEQQEKQLADLVKMYETMKPANAAAIFDTLDQAVMIDVIRRMKPAKASPILAAMKPERARDVTVELARLEALPDPAAPAAAAAPAAPPGG